MNKLVNDMEWEISNSGIPGNTKQNLEQVKELLNAKGCGFCLAKFRQVTLHLGTGMTHSCHHPTPHKIPLEEIEANPAALFNTSHLKAARKEMLNGERPEECDYCWRVEDKGGTSDRFYKSLEPWALSDHDNIVDYSGDENLYPSYLEVSFSNVCNLMCTYCGPEFSSTWVQDLKQKGPVKILEETSDSQWVQGWQDLDKLVYKSREYNPYIDAFWKWFPEASKHIKHYRITGGEPLMSKETFKSMDYFIAYPNPELEFSINSNFSVPDKLWKNFTDRLTQLKEGNKVKKITIYTSVEGWAERAEYARTNLDFSLLKSRVEEILEMGNVRVVIMSTFNIFSVTSFQELLEWVLYLKKKYNPNNTIQHMEENTGFRLVESDETDYTTRRNKNPNQSITVGIDIPYLRHPEFLDVQICGHDMVDEYLIPALTFMSENTANSLWNDHQGFETWEVEKFKRIVHERMYFSKRSDSERITHLDIVKRRYKFFDFVNSMDKRRGTDFLTTFPEMAPFYDTCKKSKDYFLHCVTEGRKGKFLKHELIDDNR